MSAYSAFNQARGNSAEKVGDQMISYDAHYSDDEDDHVLGYQNQGSSDARQAIAPSPFARAAAESFPPLRSTVVLSSENTVFDALNNRILVTLRPKQALVLNGQYTLVVLQGTCRINGLHLLHADPSKSYPILATQTQGIPVISYDDACLLNGPGYNNTVIQISCLFTGIENIGTYHPPLKGAFYNHRESQDPFLSPINPSSFEVVGVRKNLSGIQYHPSWIEGINTCLRKRRLRSAPLIILAIGEKNTGKSTFTKAMLNAFVMAEGTASYLDLDPGQTEFSQPYSLSLTKLDAPLFGLHLERSSRQVSQYLGYTTAAKDPHRYISHVKSLIEIYQNQHKLLGCSLIVNTPGWIRGFGKELLVDITKIIRPDDLFLLSNNCGDKDFDDNEVIQDLTFVEVHRLVGSSHTSSFSPHNLRELTKIAYFHRVGPYKYDFSALLQSRSPLRLSYEVLTSDNDFIGISSFAILGYTKGVTFLEQDLFLMVEATICAVYYVSPEIFNKWKREIPTSETLPYYLNPGELTWMTQERMIFAGLVIIHSINQTLKYVNMYVPAEVKSVMRTLSRDGYKMIIVKGDGEIPVCEFMSQASARNLHNVTNGKTTSLPYISSANQAKVGGVWKTRRNIMRKGQVRR